MFGYQSGHGDGAKTLQWIHHAGPAEYGKRKSFTRPAINLEPPYEGHNAYQSRQPHSDYNVRRAIYWSMLVAPPAGFTYGAHGVWSWHTKPGEEPTDHRGTGVALPWREALHMPGATQAGILRKLFESMRWYELRPAQQLVRQASEEPEAFVACAATPDNGQVIVYLPRNATLQFTDEALAKSAASAKWYDPKTGQEQSVDVDWKTPDPKQDWVLIVRR